LSATPSFYPSLYAAASKASASGQSQYVLLVRLNLGLLFAASALSVLGVLLQSSSVWLVLIIDLLAAMAVRVYGRQAHPEHDWFNGRAVAESIKTAAWRFAMRATPFHIGDANNRDARFIDRVSEILNERRQLRLARVPASDQTISDEMRRVSALDWTERRDIYVARRLDNQIDWYSTKAETSQRRSIQWTIAALTAECAAVACAVLLLAVSTIPNAVGLFTSLAAGATAWTQLRRHDDLAQSYSLAAVELRLAKARVVASLDAAAFVSHVDDTEETVSREHTLWAIKRGVR
jgi:hypothetical protein